MTKKTTTAPTPAAVNALQPEWLLRQAIDYFKSSRNTDRSPGSRALNLRKSIDLIKQLLPLIGERQLIASFKNQWGVSCNNAEVIIAELARGSETPATKPDTTTPPEPAKPSADLSEINRLLAGGLTQLVEALKLLNPAPAIGKPADATAN
jgi:hypothetical protein